MDTGVEAALDHACQWAMKCRFVVVGGLLAALLTSTAIADVTIEKIAPDRVDSGEVFTYELVVDNTGDSPVPSVSLLDQLPEGLGLESVSGDDWDCDIDDEDERVEIDCDYDGSLEPGKHELALEVRAPQPASSSVLTNTAYLFIDGDETDADSQSTTVEVLADLRLGLTVDPTETAYAGETIRYTFEVENQGPHAAADLVVAADFSSADLELIGEDGDFDCSLTGQSLTCEGNAALAPGSTRELDVEVEAVAAIAELTLQGSVSSAADLPEEPDNSSDTVTLTVLPSADLALVDRQLPAGPVAAESGFDYVIEVDNLGPSTAEEVVVTGRLPEGMLALEAAAPWDCRFDHLGGDFHCRLESLSADQAAALSLSVLAPRNPPEVGGLSAPASFGPVMVESATHDPDPDNNTADDPLALEIEADWSLTIEKSIAGFDEGGVDEVVVPNLPFQYEITVTNHGPSDLVEDLRPLLSDEFDQLLRADQEACEALPGNDPCWRCTGQDTPAPRQVVDTPAPDPMSGLGGAWGVVVSPDNRHVYAGGRFDDSLVGFERITERGAQFGFIDQGTADLQSVPPRPRALAISANGRFLAVATWLADGESADGGAVVLFERDPVDGSLSELDRNEDYDGVSDLVFSPDSGVLYLADAAGDAIVVFDVNDDLLDPVQTISRSETDDILLGGVGALVIHSETGHLHAAAPDDAALVSFSRQSGTGQLSPLSPASVEATAGGESVAIETLAISPVRDELVAGGESSVVLFSLEGGTPEQTGSISASASLGRPLSGVGALSWRADGNEVLVAAREDRRLVRLRRSSSGSSLNFQSATPVFDGVGETELIPQAITLDPGGERAYVTATDAPIDGLTEPEVSAVAVFGVYPPAACEGLGPIISNSGDIEDLPLMLPAGQKVTVEVFTRLAASATVEELENIATLVDARGQEQEGQNLVDVIVATDISVSQSEGDDRVQAGEPFEFIIEITNNGPISLTAMTLEHAFELFDGPGSVGFESGSTGWTCEASGNACCTSGGGSAQCGVTQPTPFVAGDLDGHQVDIGSGATLTFTAGGRLHPSSDGQGEIFNTIELVPDGVDALNPAALIDTTAVAISAVADFWLTKSSLGLETIDEGNDDWPDGTELVAGYRIRTGNRGPAAGAGVTLRDLLDDDDALLADQARWNCRVDAPGEDLAQACCAFADGGSTCDQEVNGSGALDQVLALAPGSRVVVDLHVPVDELQSDGTLVNEAELVMPDGLTDLDPATSEARLTTRLAATAELNVVKSILAGETVTPGEEVTFEIIVTNDGPDDVPVTVQDHLPESLDNVSWSCDASTPIPGDLIFDTFVGAGELFASGDVITSADGRHVYVSAAGQPGNDDDPGTPAAVAVYERNVIPGPGFGDLSLLEVEVDGEADDQDSGTAVENMAGAGRMALSPDGRHLYVTAAEDDAIVVFQRDHIVGSPDFGRLTFAEARRDGSDQPGDTMPVEGLRGASDVVVSHDGEHVYVTGRRDNALAVFQRDFGTGTLSFRRSIDAAELADSGHEGLWSPLSVAISPDDQFVYATGRGLQTGFEGSDWTTSDAFSGPDDTAYFVDNTSGIDLKWLTQERPILVPEVDGVVLEFEHLHSLDTPFSCFDVGVLEVSIDGGETWRDVTDLAGATFDTGGYNGVQNGSESNPLDRREGWCGRSDGWLDEQFSTVRVDLGDEVTAGTALMLRFGLGEGIAIGADGWWIDSIHLYDSGNGNETLFLDTVTEQVATGDVVVFERQGDSSEVGFGELDPVQSIPLSAAADAAVMDANGENLYVGSGDGDGRLWIFGRAIGDGQLLLIDTIDDLSDAAGFDADALSGLAALAVSPDGEHLMASGAAVDRLSVFRRQPLIGTLIPFQMLAEGDRWPEIDEDLSLNGGIAGVRGVAFSSDGLSVFTAAQPNQLGVFERLAPDPTFGFLEAVFDEEDDGFGNTASGLLGARAAALSPDERWVFATGFGQLGSADSGALVVLERDPGATEAGRHLRFRQALKDGSAGVTGLDGAVDVAVVGNSNDGNDIYVVSERDAAIAHFRQPDPGSAQGEVEFVEAIFDDSDEAEGLSGAAAVIVSPSGQHVYVAGRFDHTVAIFSRDTDTGELEFIDTVEEGVDGVSGLLGANALVASADGQHLYVASRQSDAVVVFDIDGDALHYRQAFFDGTEGAVLTSASALALSRDGAHLMVTSLDGDSVTVLARETDPTVSSLFGRVRFHSVVTNFSAGAEALRGPRDIAVDADDDRVYVVSQLDDAMVILDRNTSVGGDDYGRLTPLEVRRQGVGNVIGMESPYGLAVSSGARRNIYVASLGSQSLGAFVRRSGSSCSASGGGALLEDVFVAANGTVRFTVTATINPGATGTLQNEVTISVPDDVENTGENNSAMSAEVSLEPFSELSVSKTNDRLSVTAGERQHYRIAVDNAGPSSAIDVAISDWLDPDDFLVDTATWSCRAVGAGLLDPMETLSQTGQEIDSLAGAAQLAWAAAPHANLPERVYVAGVLGNALTALALDPATGELITDTALIDGGDDASGASVTGLRGLRGVTTSADGRFIYATSQVDNRIVVVEVEVDDDSADNFGGLSMLEQWGPGDAGLADLNQPVDVALSGDGASMYVAAANTGAIYVFDVDAADGGLELNQVVERTGDNGLGGVAGLVLSPDDEHLYAAGANDAAVSVFRRQADGSLEHMQTRSSPGTPGLTGVSALALDAAGANLYAVGRGDHAIVVFTRIDDPDSDQFGRLASGTVQRVDGSDLPVLRSPRDVVVGGDGGSLYVAAYGTDSLLAFRRDRGTGELEYLTRYQSSADAPDLGGVLSLATDASGERLFTAALADSAVTRFERGAPSQCGIDSGTGDVELSADVAAGGAVLIDLAVDVHPDTGGQPCPPSLDPDRQCIINQVDIDLDQEVVPDGDEWQAIDASFLARSANLVVDKTDGLAEFRGLLGARALAASTVVGEHLYVAAPGEPGIGVFALEPDLGGPTGDYPLTFVQKVLDGEGGVSQLNGIGSVLASPDGQHVYVSSRLDSSIIAFERDAESGHLSLLAIYSNNTGGVSEMSGAAGLAMDADGEHLYVAGSNSNAVVVFRRQADDTDEDFGHLSFQQSLQEGTAGVQNLVSPRGLDLSADGRHLYAAAPGSDSVVVFRRISDDTSSDFGDLTWIQSRTDLSGGVSGLLDVSGVTVSADGRAVYAVGTGSNSLVWFDRQSDSEAGDFGRIAFGGRVTDGEDGALGLAGVSSMTLMGEDQEYLAATSPELDSVAVYARDLESQALSLLDHVVDGDADTDGDGDGVLVRGLAEARAVMALEDEARIFVASSDPGAIAAFTLESESLSYDGAMVHGEGGAVPGEFVEYVITVHNEGPSRVTGARLVDQFPTAFDSVSWTCQISSPASACPGEGGEGNIDALIDVGAGDTVTFFAEGSLRPDASGYVVNEAWVEMPAGVVDLDPDSNSAIDDDTVVSAVSDLAVTIEDLPAEIQPGAVIDYRLRVENLGSSNAASAEVVHLPPEALRLSQWSCEADREPGRLALGEAPPETLAAFRAAQVSPDGRHFYGVGANEDGTDAIVMFRRDSLSGALLPQQQLDNLDTQTTPDGDVTIDGLADARSIAVSPDGRHVYVAGYADDAIAVFSRDDTTGQLQFVEVVRDNIGDVEGLGGPIALAMPASGGQLYVAGSLDDAVVVFDRDADSGELSFAQVRRNQVGGVTGLQQPVDLVLVDGDASLLVAAPGSHSLVQFERDGDGQLQPEAVFTDGDIIEDGPDTYPVEGLDEVRAVVVSDDQQWLHVLSGPAQAGELATFERLSSTVIRSVRQVADGDAVGTPPNTVSGLAQATDLALTASDRQLYVAGSTSDGAQRTVAAFGLDDPETIQFLGRFDGRAMNDTGRLVRLATAPDGRHVYAQGGDGPDIDPFALLGGSSCGRSGQDVILDTVALEAGGEIIYEIQARAGANARGQIELEAGVEPGVGVLDPDLTNNFDAQTSQLQPASGIEVVKTLETDPVVAGEPVSWTVEIHNHGPSTVRGLDVFDELPALPGDDPAPGEPGVLAGSAQWQCEASPRLDIAQAFAEDQLAGADGVAFSADGLWVAASGTESDTVTLYSRDPADGWLTEVTSISEGDDILDGDGDVVDQVVGLAGASDLMFAPEADFLYVVARNGHAVSWFEIDAEAGELIYSDRREHAEVTGLSLIQPVRLVASEDARHVYVAARESNAVTVFERDSVTGQLSWLESRRSGVGLPLNVLDGVRDLSISPDGRFLYAAAAQYNGIAIFELGDDGRLTWRDRIRNGDSVGEQVVAGLGLVQSIGISGRGEFLFAASLADDSVTVFGRDADSGALEMLHHYHDGLAGLEGLDGANGVIVDPDGEHLVVSALNSGQVSVFERDWDSGELELVEALILPQTQQLRRLALSPSGDHLLAAGGHEGGALLNLLRRGAAECGIDSLSADTLVDLIDMDAGSSLRYTVDALVHPGARGDLVNTAEATLPPGHVALSPDTHVDSDGAMIDVVSDLTMAKSIDGDAGSLVAGNPVTFVLDVRNEGPGHAFEATVIDTLDAALLDAEWTCQVIPGDSVGSDCPAAGSGDLAESIDLLVGERLLFLIEATIAPDFSGQLVNTAEVAPKPGVTDPDPDNNIDGVSAGVSAVADVSMTKTATETFAVPGQGVTFGLVVVNHGPSDAPEVAISDDLPDGLEPDGWTCQAPGDATCPEPSGTGVLDLVAALPAGAELHFEVAATVALDQPPGDLVNVASAVVLGSEVGDPDPSNNTDQASIEVGAAQADVSVTKTVDPPQALPGDAIVYDIVVGNAGPGVAEAVHVIDTMPEELIDVTWSCQGQGGAVCPVDLGEGDIDITIDEMPVGAELLITVDAVIDPKVSAGPGEVVVNVVTAESPVEDPDPDNNQATAVISLDLDILFQDRFEVSTDPRSREETR